MSDAMRRTGAPRVVRRTALLLALAGCTPGRLRPMMPGVAPDSMNVAGLPLAEEAPPAGAPARGAFVVLLTGDGGWVGSDKGIARPLLARGLAVVAWDSRAWLQQRAQDPASAGRDLERVIRTYTTRWRRDTVIVVGYSRGADLAPFAVNRLSPASSARVRAVALVSPSARASFEFHWIDIVKDVERPSDRDARPELARLEASHPVLCNRARDEGRASLCPSADTARVRVVVRQGGHVIQRHVGVETGESIADWLGGLQ